MWDKQFVGAPMILDALQRQKILYLLSRENVGLWTRPARSVRRSDRAESLWDAAQLGVCRNLASHNLPINASYLSMQASYVNGRNTRRWPIIIQRTHTYKY